MTGKRVLLFAPKFFGYEKEIANKIKEFGAAVDLYDERANPTTIDKILIRLHIFFPVKSKIKKYYNSVIVSGKSYDYVIFVNPETVDVSLLNKVKKKFNSAKFILYMWDSLENKPFAKDIIPLFDRKLSFNKSDCEQNGLVFRPLFFIDTYDSKNIEISHEIKYDVSFMGTIHSDRYFVLKKIKTWVENAGLKSYFFMYFPSKILYFKYRISNLRKHIDKNDFSYSPKKSSEIKDILLSSNVVVDIQHPKQIGLTMRTVEMLGLGKKLITTNADIRNYDFYNPRNILVIDRDNPVIDEDFIRTPYEEIDEDIRKRYSLEGFVGEIIDIEMNEIAKVSKQELLDIFITEEDRNGRDLLAMSDFFDVLIRKINVGIDSDKKWKNYQNIESLSGQIAAAIKGGFDISKMGMLVADYSHFNQEIIDGLKEGIYHVGESKEVAGNLRPAILDENEQLVKFFTLKEALNPAEVLSDISTLSMQIFLKRMSAQIEDVGRDVKELMDFERREKLDKPFMCARDSIKRASTADSEKQECFLDKADGYLMEGLESLYLDIYDQVNKLAKQKGLFIKVNKIDIFLSYISEDMKKILRYVGLRVYLFNLRGKDDDANRVLGDYQSLLQTLTEKKIGDEKYTAFELIHEYYPYDEENMDFWLEMPKQMIKALDSYKIMLDQKNNDIFYIGVEDDKYEC
ncbi:MAG: hypothetical protein HDR32_03335 [Treponema sp.]|nr:hypothetical protein [Treponema sp.]